MKSLRAICLILEQDIFRQRIRESKSYEIAGAFSFYVRQKTARVNTRLQRVCRFRFDTRCTKLEFHVVNPRIAFLRNHRGTVGQRGGRVQCFVSRKNRRHAECNSALRGNGRQNGLMKDEREAMRKELRETSCDRNSSAELHSAVSQIFNLPGVRKCRRLSTISRLAECDSAIRQITNLRYVSCATQIGQTFYNGFTHRAGNCRRMPSRDETKLL